MSNEWKKEIDSYVCAIELLARKLQGRRNGQIIPYTIRKLKKIQLETSRSNVLAQVLQMSPFKNHPDEVKRYDKNCLNFIVRTRMIFWDDDVPHLLTNIQKADVSYFLGYIIKDQIENLHDRKRHGAADIVSLVLPQLQVPLKEALNIVEEGF